MYLLPLKSWYTVCLLRSSWAKIKAPRTTRSRSEQLVSKERSSPWVELCLWIYTIYLSSTPMPDPVSQLVSASDRSSEVPGSNPGWILNVFLLLFFSPRQTVAIVNTLPVSPLSCYITRAVPEALISCSNNNWYMCGGARSLRNVFFLNVCEGEGFLGKDIYGFSILLYKTLV